NHIQNTKKLTKNNYSPKVNHLTRPKPKPARMLGRKWLELTTSLLVSWRRLNLPSPTLSHQWAHTLRCVLFFILPIRRRSIKAYIQPARQPPCKHEPLPSIQPRLPG